MLESLNGSYIFFCLLCDRYQTCCPGDKIHAIHMMTLISLTTSLSTYDFSTLYTTLPHNLIKENLINLIGWTFKRDVHLILPVTKDRLSSLLKTQNDINFGLAKTSVKP